MKKCLMTLFARTPVHVGAGNSVGAIDSPVQRERHTRIPVIPGSSLKGVLADLWSGDLIADSKGNLNRQPGSDAEWLFGSGSDTEASAGSLLIGEARVLAFPVRSAKGSFAWITCPLSLSRLVRDWNDSFTADISAITPTRNNQCFASSKVVLEEQVVLEEYLFDQISDSAPIAEKIKNLTDDEVWKSIEDRLVILNDEMFSYFVENACEVVTRIRVDDRTGTVAAGALFNQEQVPSETLFYAVIGAQAEMSKRPEKRDANQALHVLAEKITSDQVQGIIQVGGDETIGLGFCSVKIL